jgi:hypothetical protein
MINSLRRSLLLLVLGCVASHAAAGSYSWPATTEAIFIKKTVKKDGKDAAAFEPASWFQVEVLDDGQLVLATRWDWYDRKNIGNDAFKPVLDPANYDIALPLFKLVAKNSATSADKKAELTMFDAKTTPYWLYVRFKDDAKGRKPAQSIKKDKPTDDFVANRVPGQPFFSVLWKGVKGMSEKGLPTTDKEVRVAVNQLTEMPVQPSAPGAALPPGVVALSPFEEHATFPDSLVPDCPKRDHSCRPHLKQALTDYVKVFKEDAPISQPEQGFLKARLGDDGYAKFQAWEKFSKEMKADSQAEFTRNWRKAIRQEAEGYTLAKAPAEYRPEATNTGVRALLTRLGDAPTTAMAKELYKHLPGDGPTAQARRKVLESYYQTPEKLAADIKDRKDVTKFLAIRAGDVAHVALLDPAKKEDQQKIKNAEKDLDKAGIARARLLDKRTLLNAYCDQAPGRPLGGAAGEANKSVAIDGARPLDGMKDAQFWQAEGVTNTRTNATPREYSEQELLCSEHWNSVKRGNALSGGVAATSPGRPPIRKARSPPPSAPTRARSPSRTTARTRAAT